MPIQKWHLLAQAGVLAPVNPRRSAATPAVANSLQPWPEPKSTISGWTLFSNTTGFPGQPSVAGLSKFEPMRGDAMGMILKFLVFALLIWIMALPSAHARSSSKSRFFYSGDGYIRLFSEKNGKRFNGRYRDMKGHYDDGAYGAISAVFGAPNSPLNRSLSLRLIEYIDYLEDRLGQGALVTITSGYRPPEYNRNLRKRGALAAKASLHQYGMAADFIMDGVPSKRVWETVRSIGFGGTGYYHGKTVHVDVGPARSWDEKSSGVGTGLSDDNKLIGMVTDFDFYNAGDSIRLTFIRMTAFPVRVNTNFSLIPIDNRDDSEKVRLFEPKMEISPDGDCVSFTNIGQMASLEWRLPSDMPSGRYTIRVRFCEKTSEKMPEAVTTPEFEIR